MNCEEILTLLDAYFDNELDLAKTVAIEEHLRTCAGCRSQYELRVALRSQLEDPDLRYAAPNDFAEQIRKRLALSSRPTRKILSFRAAAWIPAAVAAAAVFGAFVYANIGRLIPTSSGKRARTWTISCTTRGLNPLSRHPASRAYRYRAHRRPTQHRANREGLTVTLSCNAGTCSGVALSICASNSDHTRLLSA
jgi:Putative zinc-finger